MTEGMTHEEYVAIQRRRVAELARQILAVALKEPELQHAREWAMETVRAECANLLTRFADAEQTLAAESP
jgi:uncharacterized protein YdhG (YjbR/CyaY superfamily)